MTVGSSQPGRCGPAGAGQLARRSHHPQRLETARARRRPADSSRTTFSSPEQTISTSEPVASVGGRISAAGRRWRSSSCPASRTGVGRMSAASRRSSRCHIDRLHLELGPEAEKGTGPICRNGPTNLRSVPGVSHKLDQSFLHATLYPGGDCLQRPLPVRRHSPRRHLSRQRRRASKMNPTGDPDQIASDLLSLWFIERPKDAKTTKDAKTPGSLDLIAERLEAIGNPVVVAARAAKPPQAKRIEYNLLTKSITLDGDEPVFLQQGPNEIHARSLYYQSAAEEGRSGHSRLAGPRLAPRPVARPVAAAVGSRSARPTANPAARPV